MRINHSCTVAIASCGIPKQTSLCAKHAERSTVSMATDLTRRTTRYHYPLDTLSAYDTRAWLYLYVRKNFWQAERLSPPRSPPFYFWSKFDATASRRSQADTDIFAHT